MLLSDLLRRCVLNDVSISVVARETGVPQPTLQEFAKGKSDGTYADLRLSSAERLLDYYGLDRNLNYSDPEKKGLKRMRLAEELKACECSDSPEKFRDRLIDGLKDSFPGRTIDSLICSPLDAQHFCDRIREGIGSDALGEVVVLKALVNIRKRKDCPRNLKPFGSRRNLKRSLQEAGCQLEPNTFKELVTGSLASMYKNQTIDEIVCHPREARMLCNYIRNQAKCLDLSDDLILSTLMNVRKAAGQA